MYKLFRFLPDRIYLKLQYYHNFHKKLNLKTPQTFNEKIQWLKLNDRKEIYTTMVDKYDVKEYVAKIIGKEYIVPTIGIYDKFDDIEFDKLPNQFVIKCTHDSGGLVICKDKTNFDINDARKKISRSLKTNYYYYGREWAYKNVRPRIIVEEYLKDNNNQPIRDYKIFCFNGNPKMLYVSDNSHTTEQTIAFFDENYKQLPIKRNDYNEYKELPKKPVNFEKMKRLSGILSKDIPHIRVDWYEINNMLYFGELTLYTSSGMVPFEDEKWNRELGAMINLPIKKGK